MQQSPHDPDISLIAHVGQTDTHPILHCFETTVRKTCACVVTDGIRRRCTTIRVQTTRKPEIRCFAPIHPAPAWSTSPAKKQQSPAFMSTVTSCVAGPAKKCNCVPSHKETIVEVGFSEQHAQHLHQNGLKRTSLSGSYCGCNTDCS